MLFIFANGVLNVRKFQKQITLFSFPPKTNENPFLILPWLLRAELEKYFHYFLGGNLLLKFSDL